MGGRYDIQTVQGDMVEKLFEYCDPSGNPIDMSDIYAIMMMRVSPTDPEPAISLDSRVVGGGILFVDPNNNYAINPQAGAVFMKVTRSQAALVAPPGGWYQVKMYSNVDPDFEDTLVYGKYEIFPEVAHD